MRQTGQCDKCDQILVKSFASTVVKDKFEGQSRESLKGELGNWISRQQINESEMQRRASSRQVLNESQAAYALCGQHKGCYGIRERAAVGWSCFRKWQEGKEMESDVLGWECRLRQEKPKGDGAKQVKGYVVRRHSREMGKWWYGDTSEVKK